MPPLTLGTLSHRVRRWLGRSSFFSMSSNAGAHIAHLYARAECGTWCEFVLDGAAYQPECPVHLLSLDALHFVHGEPTAHDVNFRMSRVTMADGKLIDLKRDKSLRLHFIEIMPYADFIKLNVPDHSVVEYCF